jgi:hypothetical protein
MRCWHLCPDRGIALGAAAKCGSTALTKLVKANEPNATGVRMGWSDVPQGFETVAVVRHPIDRFASLYANIQERPRSRWNFYAQFEGLSPWYCFDKLLEVDNSLTYDFHFQAQSLCLGPRLDVVVRLEHFAGWWIGRYPDSVAPEQLNMTRNRVELDDRTQDRVMNRYRDDLALWERAYAGT